jgi:hypothetical protein
MSYHVSFCVCDGDAAGNAGGTDVIAAIFGLDRATDRRELYFLADILGADRSRYGLCLYRASNTADRDSARDTRSRDRSLSRNFHRVRDRDVMHAGHFLADSEGVAAEFDRRVRDNVIQTLLGVSNANSLDTHVAVNVDFAVGAADDAHVSGNVR